MSMRASPMRRPNRTCALYYDLNSTFWASIQNVLYFYGKIVSARHAAEIEEEFDGNFYMIQYLCILAICDSLSAL